MTREELLVLAREETEIDDPPSHIYHDKNHIVKVWYKDIIDKRGLLQKLIHRENDLPAKIVYYSDRTIYQLSWYNLEKLHRENDLPSQIMYDKSGKKVLEIWYKKGQRHRIYAPAYIPFKGREEWRIEGRDITNQVNKFINDYNLPKWQEWDNSHRMLFKIKFYEIIK